MLLFLLYIDLRVLYLNQTIENADQLLPTGLRELWISSLDKFDKICSSTWCLGSFFVKQEFCIDLSRFYCKLQAASQLESCWNHPFRCKINQNQDGCMFRFSFFPPLKLSQIFQFDWLILLISASWLEKQCDYAFKRVRFVNNRIDLMPQKQ